MELFGWFGKAIAPLQIFSLGCLIMKKFTDKEIIELYELLKIPNPFEGLRNDLTMERSGSTWNIMITTDTVGLEINNG
ncbi:MAG: hypothetical protein WC695_09250 [Candidatus Omnitrophota bacterium]